jgi:hypothetical protein
MHIRATVSLAVMLAATLTLGALPPAQATSLAAIRPRGSRAESQSSTPAFNASVFGVDMPEITPKGGLTEMLAAGANWVRRDGIWWSKVESKKGSRDWSVLAPLEQEFINASNAGLRAIVIIHGTPGWAQKVQGYECGPISDSALSDFADFVREAVRRYSAPPYNVKYWELWNEPDVDPSLVSPNSPFGCYGDQDDPYYGGGTYADMLRAVYPHIKAVDPQATVVLGGLLLGCDITPGRPIASCPSAKFLEGILRAGGEYFDVLAFHSYDSYTNGLGHYGHNDWHSYWNTTGPLTISKARFVREVMSRYGVDKPLMNNEMGLLCVPWWGAICDSKYETTKAYYVAQAHTVAIAESLQANIWFSVFGWMGTQLLNPDYSPTPAYAAYRLSHQKLNGASFWREIAEYPGLKGYEFYRGDQRIWVMWSITGQDHFITLPERPVRMTGALGVVSPIVGRAQVIGAEPQYVEFSLPADVATTAIMVTAKAGDGGAVVAFVAADEFAPYRIHVPLVQRRAPLRNHLPCDAAGIVPGGSVTHAIDNDQKFYRFKASGASHSIELAGYNVVGTISVYRVVSFSGCALLPQMPAVQPMLVAVPILSTPFRLTLAQPAHSLVPGSDYLILVNTTGGLSALPALPAPEFTISVVS